MWETGPAALGSCSCNAKWQQSLVLYFMHPCSNAGYPHLRAVLTGPASQNILFWSASIGLLSNRPLSPANHSALRLKGCPNRASGPGSLPVGIVVIPEALPGVVHRHLVQHDVETGPPGAAGLP